MEKMVSIIVSKDETTQAWMCFSENVDQVGLRQEHTRDYLKRGAGVGISGSFSDF